MEEVLQVLRKKYHPAGIVLYGSYADGTNNARSDFDALLITASGMPFHDTGMIEGIRMDVFGYPMSYFESSCNPEEFVQIYGGKILLDENGIAENLMKYVERYVVESAARTGEEKQALCVWCRKMLLRASENDPEGLFRAHWLLTDSLSVYCEMRDRFYFGPKKTIAFLKSQDPFGYRLFCSALREMGCLEHWIEYIMNTNPQEE